MGASDKEFEEHVKREATTRWKWKNPWIGAVLSLIVGPFGYFYFSWKKALIGLVVLLVAAQILRYNGWWPAPVWLRVVGTLAFAAYAYLDIRWTNAAIEYYKHGLPGTGTQKPPSS